MKNKEKDILKSLFNKVTAEELSSGFENRLMERIMKEAEKQCKIKKLRSAVIMWLSIAGSILCMITAAVIAIYFAGWDSIFNAGNFRITRDINPLSIMIPTIAFFLLVFDFLIRKHIQKRKEQD